MAGRRSRISIAAFHALVRTELPVAEQAGFRVEALKAGRARTRMPFRRDHLRPGGTIAGPAMMALADYTMYAVVLSVLGAAPLAVTANLNINFLSRPRPADLLAEGRLLKLGKRLAFGEVTLYSKGRKDPVAHVTASYSIPPAKGA